MITIVVNPRFSTVLLSNFERFRPWHNHDPLQIAALQWLLYPQMDRIAREGQEGAL
jgi:hypothetical protein